MDKKQKQIILAVVAIAIVAVGAFFLLGSGGDEETENGNEDKVYKVAILSGLPIFDTAIDALKAELAEQGYEEGENIEYIFVSANNDQAVMTQAIADFIEADVDVIVTTTNIAALTASRDTAGTDIPVVFMFVIAPVESGVVPSLSDIGNVTGVRNPLEDFVGRRIELLKLINPDAVRIWAPYNPEYPNVAVVTTAINAVAPQLDVEIIETYVSSPEDVVAEVALLEEADEIPFDAIFIFPDLTVQAGASWPAILNFAKTHNLPILANTPQQVQEGALFSYLADNESTGVQAARLVYLILEGTDVKDLPIETAELSLMVNQGTADELGFTLSTEVLNQADIIVRPEDTE